MRQRRDDPVVFTLSFLDAICCGFGAIVLLLVLTKLGEPLALEQAKEDLSGLVTRLEQELHQIRGESVILERRLSSVREQLSEEQVAVARLRGDLYELRGEYAATKELSEVHDIMEGRLLAAQQELSEEMKRLLGLQYRRAVTDTTIGGIPVDSEYIIFVIDTSGSMQSYAWPLVVEKMTQVLDIYPKVKGLQIMNDMGQYMYSQYSGRWIPDTPGRRKAIIARLRSWNVFSNSSPVEGITRAIRVFATPDKQISIYVFGDEFTGSSIQEVVDTVDRINHSRGDGSRAARIHAVGFPTIFSAAGSGETTGVRFAALMRSLCRRNGGTFVGLNSLK